MENSRVRRFRVYVPVIFSGLTPPPRHQKNNIISTQRRRRRIGDTCECVFIKCWIVEKSRTCSVRWERQPGSKSTKLFTSVKIAFVLLQRPLSPRRGGWKKYHPSNQPTTHKTHNRHPDPTGKLVDETKKKNTRKIHYLDCVTQTQHPTQFMNNPVEASKLCQSRLTGKIRCVSDKYV